MLVAMGVLAAAIIFGGFAPGYQLASSARSAISPRCAARSQACRCRASSTDWPVGAAIAMAGAVAGAPRRPRLGRLGRTPCRCGAVAALGGVIVEAGRYDLLSFCFAVLIAGVGALNMLHSTAYLAHSHAQGRFFAAFTVMIAGLLGMTAGEGHLQLLRLLGADELVGAVGGDLA